MTMVGTEAPRVWVGCLACYNGAVLVGEWWDATSAPLDMEEFNADGPALPPEHLAEEHEELWVFDHENFHGLLTGECSPSEARELAEVLESVDNPAAFAAYVADQGRDYAAQDWDAFKSQFEDAFCGEYESGADYAQELAEQLGLDDDSARWPMTCVDWDRAWDELVLGGDNWAADAPGGRVFVFRPV